MHIFPLLEDIVMPWVLLRSQISLTILLLKDRLIKFPVFLLPRILFKCQVDDCTSLILFVVNRHCLFVSLTPGYVCLELEPMSSSEEYLQR